MNLHTKQRFRELAQRFYEDTMFLSSRPEYTHSAMREIINLGPSVLPLIFAEIEAGAGHWYYAVREITGEQPDTITEADAGKIGVLNEKYLQWGRERGFTDAGRADAPEAAAE